MTSTVLQSAGLAAPANWPVLEAPPRWRVVDFISDLHLQASGPETFNAWQHYMAHTRADAVFILGDLFEVWVGDDVLVSPLSQPPASECFEARCAQTLREAASRRDIFFMHGNRDFLIGPAFLQACHATLLADPTVLNFGGQRWLLTHGDALCLDDADYMQFRAQVRSTRWQQAFLDRPLDERKAIAQGLRQTSENRKRAGMGYADVDTAAATAWLDAAQAATLIHGHTHKPADHDLGQSRQRIVLSDWDAAAVPARAEVLRLSAGGPDQAGRVSPQRLSALAP